jgi:hypothetical protein
MIATSVDRDSDPDLSLDCILGGAEEGLDAEMLLDPLEEKLHLPTAFVERANRSGWKLKVVRQEDQCLAGLWIFEADTPEMLRVTVTGKRSVEGDGLVADDACRPVAGSRVDAPGIGVRLRPGDKKRTRLIECEQPLEIEIRPIHHVESTGLGDQQIEHVDIVQFAVGDVDEGGNGPAQIEQGMQFDRCLGGSEGRPGKHREAEIDRGRIERVNPCWSAPRQTNRLHTAVLPERSADGQTRRRSASRATRWRRPASNDSRDAENPCDRAWPPERTDKPRYRAGSPDT